MDHTTDAERLVGRREVAVRGVVVGVALGHGATGLHAEFGEPRPNGGVVGGHFHFDFVHLRRYVDPAQKRGRPSSGVVPGTGRARPKRDS